MTLFTKYKSPSLCRHSGPKGGYWQTLNRDCCGMPVIQDLKCKWLHLRSNSGKDLTDRYFTFFCREETYHQ